EQFTTSADLTYLTAPLGIAGVDSGFGASHGNPQITYGWTYYFTSANGMDNALYHLYPETTNSAIDAEIIDHISAGANFYNYTAHGDVTIFADPYFSISDIDGLGNAGEYPLVVGNCCLTNSFGTDECFGEAWLNAPNQGAIGYIGASMSTYWDEDLAMGVGIGDASVQNQEPPALDTANPGMYDGAMVLRYASQAATKHVGLMAVEASGSGYTDDYWSSYHLMGDPSVMIYFGIPSDPIATHNGVIPPAVTSFTVNTDPYSYVAMGDQDGNLHGAAQANSSGVANVTVIGYSPGDTAKLVITGQFKKPYFADVLCTGDTGGTYSQSTTSLGYGSVNTGGSSTLQFTLTNDHNSEYMLGDITTIAGYTVLVAAKGDIKDVKNTLAYSVAPNSDKTFDLVFEPIAAGDYNGDITITSSDTGHSNETIAVTGACVVPDIDIPVSVAASAAPGGSVVKNFDIDNLDAGDLSYNIAINYTSGKDIKASGGPDTYGYKWKDSDEVGGPVYSWVEINGSGTALGLSDDGISGDLALGFTLNYYGVDYTTIKVGANGAATFTGTAVSYTNATIPTSATANALLAVFWDDLNPADGGEIYYYADGVNNRFIIEWDAVPDYGTSGAAVNTFQIILYSSGKIIYQYANMTGELISSTVGIEDHNGTDGSLVVYNAAYLKDDLAVQFQATPEWLSLDATSGSIVGIGTDVIVATCDAAELELGVYTADIIITSNDPDESTKTLPVTFTVTDVVLDPDVPANIVISISGSDLVIDWDVSANATGYDVYSSDDPYGTFILSTSVGTNQYTVAADQAKLFYYIVAKN
ncbi:MAG: hypothetical protein GQ534_05760, partial [Candidatus Delongbacteria bacterium]|nr:hypothetical protein [Candidatus Delongbacteria bacterium]